MGGESVRCRVRGEPRGAVHCRSNGIGEPPAIQMLEARILCRVGIRPSAPLPPPQQPVSAPLAISIATPSVLQTGLQLPTGIKSLRSFDFNGDGISDLLVTGDGIVRSFLGHGDGTFSPGVDVATVAKPGLSLPADFNGDGRLDDCIDNLADGTLSILLSNGNGTFQTKSTVTFRSHIVNSTSIKQFGDFNGDGKIDVVAFDRASSRLVVVPGNGDGTFGQPIFTPSPPPNLVFIRGTADFNRDGIFDLMTGLSDGSMEVLLGRGDGTFSPAPAQPAGFAATALADDLNGDGIPDIASASGSALVVDIGRGDGTFEQTNSTAIPFTTVTTVFRSDLTGDGKPDLCLIGSADNPPTSGVLAVPGNGDGTFGPPLFSPLPVQSGSPSAVGAFNGGTNLYPVLTDRADHSLANVFTKISVAPGANGDIPATLVSTLSTTLPPSAVEGGKASGAPISVTLTNIGSSSAKGP